MIIPAALWALVLKAWALVSPVLGPLWLIVRGWLPVIPAARWVVPGLALVGAGLVVWQVWGIIDRGPLQPATVTVDQVRASQLRAENEALKRAMTRADQTRRARELELKHERDALAERLREMEAARAASREKNIYVGAPVIDADDPWLRRKRAADR